MVVNASAKPIYFGALQKEIWICSEKAKIFSRTDSQFRDFSAVSQYRWLDNGETKPHIFQTANVNSKQYALIDEHRFESKKSFEDVKMETLSGAMLP